MLRAIIVLLKLRNLHTQPQTEIKHKPQTFQTENPHQSSEQNQKLQNKVQNSMALCYCLRTITATALFHRAHHHIVAINHHAPTRLTVPCAAAPPAFCKLSR